MSKKADDSLTRVEKHLIRSSSPWFSMIGDFCHRAKNLYNAIICTDMSLSENDIIRIYGHRWDIEVFFKTCKSSLLLRKEYHGLSYDGLTAHVAMVFTRYMLLAVSKRDNEDDRTLGELFYIMIS